MKLCIGIEFRKLPDIFGIDSKYFICGKWKFESGYTHEF